MQHFHAQASAAFHEELVAVQSNRQQIKRLLRTVNAPDERPAGAWDILKLAKAAMRTRLGLEGTDEGPLDTPHRRLATSIGDIRELVDSVDALLLSKEQTAIMQATELMRRNILSVSSAVNDFIVCTRSVLHAHHCKLDICVGCFDIASSNILEFLTAIEHMPFCVQELPELMHEMIRELSYDLDDISSFSCSASLVASRLLTMAPSCAVSAALAHLAKHREVRLRWQRERQNRS